MDYVYASYTTPLKGFASLCVSNTQPGVLHSGTECSTLARQVVSSSRKKNHHTRANLNATSSDPVGFTHYNLSTCHHLSAAPRQPRKKILSSAPIPPQTSYRPILWLPARWFLLTSDTIASSFSLPPSPALHPRRLPQPSGPLRLSPLLPCRCSPYLLLAPLD